MLGGLQSTTDSLFPALRSMIPSATELKEGELKEEFGRTVKLSGYHTEIFDMHSAKDRKAYSKLMMDLTLRIQVGKVRILFNDRKTMTRKDGSTGWFVFLEWMEFSRTDGSDVKKNVKKEA